MMDARTGEQCSFHPGYLVYIGDEISYAVFFWHFLVAVFFLDPPQKKSNQDFMVHVIHGLLVAVAQVDPSKKNIMSSWW